ncbi:4Fe-4S dicluster domain-containing protein [bacterium]|nr:4Fe-4S dicluster domain-containing protein [bacterium]
MIKINIDQERCKGCRLCVIVCPKDIIIMSEHLNSAGYHPAIKIEEKEKDCIACGKCYQMCPEVAIEINKE